ncbi:MBL fold metallo-hydrolase [Roseivirga misakiensis]|uniref:MBL fold hydrolase n=1 Tax=Roseivirga misakiensis TaxID=1563681 RepID=A0A1E5T281_9BACT|nr:MBL fold metallo-hydrolase [Roseivirga misakiensis]OEK05484.1 MBL fold hydrolase [Roseivirga misakiensis]
MKVKAFTFNPFMENTYLVYDETKEAVLIDPGCYDKGEQDELISFIEEHALEVKFILNTHGHIDHVLGNFFAKSRFGAPLWIGDKDAETLKSVEVYAPNYGFQNYQTTEVDKLLKDDEIIFFGNSMLKIVFVPGHAPGHIAFYNEDEKILIGGDVLFEGSIGRTDLPGGDYDTLINSIHTAFFKFDDDMVVYPGHGGTTTIGAEKLSNPFCKIK